MLIPFHRYCRSSARFRMHFDVDLVWLHILVTKVVRSKKYILPFFCLAAILAKICWLSIFLKSRHMTTHFVANVMLIMNLRQGSEMNKYWDINEEKTYSSYSNVWKSLLMLRKAIANNKLIIIFYICYIEHLSKL